MSIYFQSELRQRMVSIRMIQNIMATYPPATTERIQAAQQLLGVEFAKDYVSLLQQSDGVTANFFILYSCEMLPERNATYEVADYAPGFFTIGDDNGGTAILLRSGTNPSPIYVVDHGDMQEANLIQVGSNLQEWITAGCPTR
jgi:hypothetical protein